MDRASHRGPVVQRLRTDGRENVVELGADRRTEPRQSDTDDGGDEDAGPGHVLHDLRALLVSNQTLQNDPQRFDLHHVLSFPEEMRRHPPLVSRSDSAWLDPGRGSSQCPRTVVTRTDTACSRWPKASTTYALGTS